MTKKADDYPAWVTYAVLGATATVLVACLVFYYRSNKALRQDHLSRLDGALFGTNGHTHTNAEEVKSMMDGEA